MKDQTTFGKIRAGFARNKKTSAVIAVALVAGGIGIYRSATSASSAPQYVLAPARIGTLRQTVTGTGQVSASNQTDIQSQVSGTIQSINVTVGQAVHKGDLIATLDAKNAAINLENARLSLAKLVEPAKATDVSNASNNLAKSYSDAYNAVSTAYLDLPGIISGIKDLLYSPDGFLSNQRSTYLTSTAQTYRGSAEAAYDAAVDEYAKGLQEFKNSARSSATSTLDALFARTHAMVSQMAAAVAKVQSAVTFIIATQPDYNKSEASTVSASVNAWASQVNNDVSSIAAALNSVSTNRNSLTTLSEGADALDIRSAELSVKQAEQTYEDYFIRAPYDGTIGRIPVNVFGQASSGTTIATIVGEQKISTISLNEVDAAKIRTGLPVTITFDAIEGLTATGTVEQVDQVGTVSQGVVSYAVKILINTEDERIKPGMSVNTSIIAHEEENVLLVPSTAVKTQGQMSYVQVLENPFGSSTPNGNGFRRNGSTTRDFSQSENASGTARFGNGTRMNNGNGNGNGIAFTVTSSAQPRQVPVTVGDADDTNTVIKSGLSRGDFVVTRTLGASAARSAAPTIFSTLGARGPGGGNVRVSPGAAPR